MQQPLISIISPFKNTAKYLNECIDSIINQSYSNWELIAVDDHSTDQSWEIMQGYAQQDERIKVFKNDGNGIIEALRLAYSKSSGEYITRMDSDDIMHQDKLESMSNQLNEAGKGHIALGLVEYFSEKGIGEGYAKYAQWLNRLTKAGNNFSEIYKECVIPSPCFMVHRSDMDLCGAYKPDVYPEDYDLTFRFYKNGLKCIPSNKVLHYWRDYSTRTSRTHEHYAENHFLDLKIEYFLALEYDKTRPLALWGAGNKGKTMAKVLLEKDIPFHWICDNPNKIGHNIYGKILLNFNYLETLEHPQSVITVANEFAQAEISKSLNAQGLSPMQDYFFFC